MNLERKTIDKVSFITTVYNEEKSIIPFLESLFSQEVLPEEVVIVDGGSNDSTLRLILNFLTDEIKKAVDFLSYDRILSFSIFVNKDIGRYFEKQNISPFNFYELKNKLKELENLHEKHCTRPIDSEPGDELNCNKNDANLIFSAKLEFVIFDKKASELSATHLNNSHFNKTKAFFGVKLLESRGANISRGRNIAIKNASGDIICVSDAGCLLDKNWVSEITRFINCGKEYVVGGFNRPICNNFLEKCLAICIMPRREEVVEKKFMPSSRNLSFKKEVWLQVGGYPEELNWGEDMKFNFNLKANGFHIRFNPDAIVYWRMRENMRDIFKQFFRYSMGDALGRMYPYRHFIRFLSFSLLVAIILISVFLNPWILLILLVLGVGYVCKPYSRINYIWDEISKNKIEDKKSISKEFIKIMFKVSSVLFIPFLLFYIDLAKICGYAYGWLHYYRFRTK